MAPRSSSAPPLPPPLPVVDEPSLNDHRTGKSSAKFSVRRKPRLERVACILIKLLSVDLSSNLLSDLPETFSNLHNLKSLSLSNNGLKSLPSSLFKMCLMLTSLDLHNTKITMNILCQIEGWETLTNDVA
ncbi:hypothetical protein ACLB2K_005747 [Fragaria x ananassa]